MRIVSVAKRNLGLLLDSTPGERFRERYQRRQANRQNAHKLASIYKLMYLGVGVLLFLFGIVMFPLPGPGWAICLLALGLVAGEYHPAAKFLDALERLLRRTRRRETHKP